MKVFFLGLFTGGLISCFTVLISGEMRMVETFLPVAGLGLVGTLVSKE